MGLKTENLDKILKEYYENPGKRFTVREIAKAAKIPKSTAQKYLVRLRKRKLIDDNRAASSKLFKIKKINFHVERLFESGVIEKLEKELNPNCIILFGSIRKGDSDKESDIDIFAESYVKKKLNLERYEKTLGHAIQLFVEDDIRKLSDNLRQNVINGIKLQGFVKLK